MTSHRITPLTESGLLSALTVILALAAVYLPVVGVVASLVWAIPVTVLVVRHGLRWGAMAVLVSGGYAALSIDRKQRHTMTLLYELSDTIGLASFTVTGTLRGLTLGTGDVIENFLHQEHPDRETERSNDPCPDKELRRQPPLLQIGDLNVLPETQKRHAGQRDRKQHPRQVVFGTARQPDSDDRRNDLQDDGYDQQYLFNHCRIAV